MQKLTRLQALKLLESEQTPEDVIEHCKAVAELAKEIAEKIQDIDIEFVETAALLHDIGRSKTHGIRHGLVGSEILRDYPEYASVCRCHIGGGIDSREAVELGLEDEDYIPESLEEKIICFADKLISGTQRISADEAVRKFEQRLGIFLRPLEVTVRGRLGIKISR
jgi:uncharacterized protein